MKNFNVTMKDVTPEGVARGLEQIYKVWTWGGRERAACACGFEKLPEPCLSLSTVVLNICADTRILYSFIFVVL